MSKTTKSEMGFLDHLEELRWRLIKSFFTVLIASVISFNFIDHILSFLLLPTLNTSNPINLQVLSVQGMFLVKWFIAFAAGCILSLPILTYQLWQFIAPGLKLNEKKYAVPIVLFSFISFIIGITFGYLILIPYSLEFFSGMGGGYVENNFSIQYYFSFLTWLLIGSGVIFQLPVVALIFSIIGLLTPPFMRHYRRHSILAILILSSFITPPDPVSMIIMACPLIFLYELSIGVSWMVNRTRT